MSRAFKRNTQLKFDDKRVKKELHFGGTLLRKAKNRHDRPISSKDPMHLVLRSSMAKGKFSFGNSKNYSRVNDIVRKHCKKYGVKLIKYSNNFNHLHMLLKFPSRQAYMRFIRSLTGSLALAVSGASKLAKLKEIFGQKRFWDFRPFTRVIRSYRAYKTVVDYVVLNELEALGILPKRAGRLREVTKGERHLFTG